VRGSTGCWPRTGWAPSGSTPTPAPWPNRGALSAALACYRAATSFGLRPARGGPDAVCLGSGDPALGPRAATTTGRWVTGAYRFEVLPGAGHWLPEHHAEQLGRLVLEHLGAGTPGRQTREGGPLMRTRSRSAVDRPSQGRRLAGPASADVLDSQGVLHRGPARPRACGGIQRVRRTPPLASCFSVGPTARSHVPSGHHPEPARDVNASVSSNGGEALCNSSLLQVAVNRELRSYAFSVLPCGGRQPVTLATAAITSAGRCHGGAVVSLQSCRR
jgi:hypothetical protein